MVRIFKIAFAVVMGVYAAWGLFNSQAFFLLDGADLLFHEAGHVFFGFLGHTIGIWGGTLFQLLVPGGLCVAFLVKAQPYSAAVMLFWLGQNFIHISVYIKDANAQQLPLVGGGIHDWNYLLSRAELLPLDQTLGGLVGGVGVLVMAAAVLMGICTAKA